LACLLFGKWLWEYEIEYILAGTTPPVFECGATPSVKWCHVLRRAHFEAKTSPNLVPRVARW